jgi:23S rRNA pseudouridine1911/1915/1917 synthase
MRAFEVLFEDDHLIAVDKAPGVLTVPTPKRERNTLHDQLEKYMRRPLVVIHRLDRETSGVLVFGKNERTADVLMQRWHEDKVDRRYDVLTLGVFVKDRGDIASRMITTRGLRRRSSHDGAGELAVTAYEVKRRLKNATFLDVKLQTGRRNQIRVHMAEHGHPILGDVRYGDGRGHPLWRERRLALHARTLTFVHPVTREEISLVAPTPQPFLRFVDRAT